MTDDAEMDALVAELEAAGLVEVTPDEQGREVWTLTVLTGLLDEGKE